MAKDDERDKEIKRVARVRVDDQSWESRHDATRLLEGSTASLAWLAALAICGSGNIHFTPTGGKRPADRCLQVRPQHDEYLK